MQSVFVKKESIPPMPYSPDHPEKAPRNIPILGEPTIGTGIVFKCKLCSKLYNSKVELDVHMAVEHARTRSKSQ